MNISNKRMRRIIAYNEVYVDIVVDPIESFIFWSTDTRVVDIRSNDTKNLIIRANQDGSNRTILIDTKEYSPCSLAIDFVNKTIYFIQYMETNLKLLSIDYNGNNINSIVEFNSFSLSSLSCRILDFYDKALYLYNYEGVEFLKISPNNISYNIVSRKIEIENADSISKPKYSSGPDLDLYIGMMKIIDPSRQPYGENLCVDSNCSHLCIPKPYNSNKFICVCPDEQYLLPGEICYAVCYCYYKCIRTLIKSYAKLYFI